MKTRISLTIVIADARHCSNDCPGMSNDAKLCVFFREPLVWDARRKRHGNHRLEQCKQADAPIKPSRLVETYEQSEV